MYESFARKRMLTGEVLGWLERSLLPSRAFSAPLACGIVGVNCDAIKLRQCSAVAAWTFPEILMCPGECPIEFRSLTQKPIELAR